MTLVDRCLLMFVCVSAYFCLNDGLYSDHICCQPSFCGCYFPDGWGIDLKKLRSYNFSVDFEEYQFHLKLCGNDIITVNNSTNCTASLYRLQHNHSVVTECLNLGMSKDYSFVWPNKRETPYLEYITTNRTSHVYLTCDDGDKKELLFKSLISDPIYKFELTSKDVCIDGEVGGSTFGHVIGVFFIIILVLFLLYMIVGMLVLKFIRGAEGIEIIPNHEFWMSIPNRMKNMLLFCAAGCKSPPTYDRI